MIASLSAYLLVAGCLFVCGLTCVLARRNMIQILMGVELMLNGAALNFVAFSHFNSSLSHAEALSGHVVVLFVIVLAACEVAVALALILAVYRQFRTVFMNDLRGLKG